MLCDGASGGGLFGGGVMAGNDNGGVAIL